MNRLFGILSAFFVSLLVVAESSAFGPSQGEQDPNAVTHLFLMLAAFMGIIYFIVLRPQQKQQKRHQERIDNLKKGDRVVTAGGLHGTVRSTKEKTAFLEIADGVKVTINKQSVTTLLEDDEGGNRSSSKNGSNDN
jgi:preprotein translocase subunit YajC